MFNTFISVKREHKQMYFNKINYFRSPGLRHDSKVVASRKIRINDCKLDQTIIRYTLIISYQL